MKKALLLSAGFVFAAFLPAFSQVITPSSNVVYVKKGATGTGSGASWTDAVPELADALKWARDNQSGGTWNSDNPLQIWVAKGTYRPNYTHSDGGGSHPSILNSFVLVRDVAVYGGFEGNEGSLANRTNWKANPTILSGELDVPYVAGGNTYTAVCHVVVAAGPVGNAVLDGFTVTGGNAAYSNFIYVNSVLTSANSGGGIYLTVSYPALRNLIVTTNRSSSNGAGIYMQSTYSTPTVLSLSGVSLIANTSQNYGGALYLDAMKLATHNCTMTGNVGKRGAAIFSDFSNLSFVNTLVAGNHADEGVVSGGQTLYQYGAIYPKSSNLEMVNTTISANKGGPVYTGDGGNVTAVKNSIITSHNYSISGLTESKITNSIVQFLTTNNGSNLVGTTNPQFVSGRSYNDAPFTNGDYRLKPNSPVLDKGSNASYTGSLANDTDLANRARLAGASIDMGAYEGGYDPLPVRLVSFRAQKEQTLVHLKWVTAAEVNAAHFELQRSFDGKTFEAIGTVPAAGESNEIVHYQFSDYRSGVEAISYYRLRTIDKDESYEQSQIVAVKWDHVPEIIGRLYPNPVQGGKVTFDLKASGGKADITVFDLSGRGIKVPVKDNSDGTYELEVNGLHGGLYLVKASAGSGGPEIVTRLLVE